ncbi:MAG: hypothetical protein J5588_10020 [Bacteroidales bacterium]|nr:hypothetical protein [Bacteroidales bacterium]
MKKIILTVAMAILAMVSFAQIPQTFSYQGVVRDAESKIVAEKPITVSVQILQGTDDGTEVYAETHEVTTNANGLMTFELGRKNAEDFAKIDWSNAPYFVKTVAEFDGKQISGVTPLLAVPYALYAAKAGNADVDLSEYAKKTELPDAVDLSEYYKKSDVDALLAELNAKVKKLDKQLNPPAPQVGSIPALYSISEDKQIYFSQGNLQYQASTNTWRFAEQQYDIIGSNNSNISESYEGWIDLFGWGTSGYNGKNPYMTSTDYSDYGDGTNDIAGTNYDWGVYNKISNGGNQAGMWRTLTSSEWNYLISGRAQANRLMGQGRVNNVNGLILLPDSWATETPSSVRFTYDPGNYSTNVYSLDEWAVMQSYGAVFLPATGDRYGTDVYDVGSDGYCWSTSAGDYGGASSLLFYSSGVRTNYYGSRYGGLSVRLVQEVK